MTELMQTKRRKQIGASLIEILTAIAILGIGVWALVTLFPKGQRVIHRTGIRQVATQLARETVSDFFADPAKMPFAIVPFEPMQLLDPKRPPDHDNPPIQNLPLLLEPVYLRDVRRVYNFVWGEPLGLILIDNPLPNPPEWRCVLRFAPMMNLWRIYREVKYYELTPPTQDFTFSFNPRVSKTEVYLLPSPPAVSRPDKVRILRVTYELASPIDFVREVIRELYVVGEGQGQFSLRQNASRVIEVVEEFRLVLNTDAFLDINEFEMPAPGVFRFANSMPRPPTLSATDPRLLSLRSDYFIDDPIRSGGHWLVETSSPFDDDDSDGRVNEDPINEKDDDGDGKIDEDDPNWVALQTTFSNILWRINGEIPFNRKDDDGDGLIDEDPPIQAVRIDPGLNWGNPIVPAPSAPEPPPNSDPRFGIFLFPKLTPGTPIRISYRTTDDWFVQVIKPPDEFQLVPDIDGDGDHDIDDFLRAKPPLGFPFERLRWFVWDDNERSFFFSPLLAGLSLEWVFHVEWQDGSRSEEPYRKVMSINDKGKVSLSGLLNGVPSPTPITSVQIDGVRSGSLLIRVSGRPLWQQEPPKSKSDYVELLTVMPPAQQP